MAGHKTKTTEQRFWEKVNKTETCWLWTAAKRDGYGRFCSNRFINVLAHRFAKELALGRRLLPTEIVHHNKTVCKSTLCVRHEHTEILTEREHVKRHRRKGPYAKRQAAAGSVI